MNFGGPGRVPHDPVMFSDPEGEPGRPETNFNNRPHSFTVCAPCRTLVVYANMDDKARWNAAAECQDLWVEPEGGERPPRQRRQRQSSNNGHRRAA